MKLLLITLTNFQGIKRLCFELGGKSARVYGDNATGKTTLYNAITWLLFDRASTGVKGFTPKTRDANGEVHNLEHSVEAVFSANDGAIVTLKKTFKEVYKVKRGTATKEFTGHTIDYYIDGVPAKEKEFQTAILNYCQCDANTIKMLTMPDYFPEQLEWKDRRKMLLEICGDVSDCDVFLANEDLEELKSFLEVPGADRSYSIDEYKKIADAKRKDINAKLAEIPARIDEANRVIDQAAEYESAEAIEKKISELEKQKDTLVKPTADESAARLRSRINELQGEIAIASREFGNKQRVHNNEIKTAISEHNRAITDLEFSSKVKVNERKMYCDMLAKIESNRQSIIAEIKETKAMVFDENSTFCPTCGQRLPENQIFELREKFNINKSNALESLTKRGKEEASKERIAEINAKIEQDEAELDEIGVKIEQERKAIAELEASFETVVEYQTTDDYKNRMAEISRLKAEINDADKLVDEAEKVYAEDCNRLRSAISEQFGKLTKARAAAEQTKRIAELESQEKELAAEYEKLEQGIYLCEEFTRRKVSMLSELINGKFKNVRFRLFVDQINGGIKEDCEVMIPASDGRMVPYSYANNAARINAGLEIIDTISKHYGVSMPVVVDNAESVTAMMPLEATQIIKLYVSEADKKLRLELEQ